MAAGANFDRAQLVAADRREALDRRAQEGMHRRRHVVLALLEHGERV